MITPHRRPPLPSKSMYPVFYAFLLLLMALVAPAQTPVISTRILTYAPAGVPDEMHPVYRSGKEILDFSASAVSLGAAINYSGPRTFSIYASREDLNPPPAGQNPPAPLASVNLPPTSDGVLIICTRTAQNKIGLVAFDIATSRFKPGDYHFFNFSRSTISIILGEEKVVMEPGQDKFTTNSKWQKEELALPLKMATVVEGEAKMFYSRFWEHYPGKRNLLFLFDGQDPSQPVTVTCMNAFLPPQKESSGSGTGPAPATP